MFSIGKAAKPTHEAIENISDYITAVETRFCSSARDGHLVIGVSGGSAVEVTAAALERLYKGGQVKKVDIFFCDERIVPEDDAESIYGAYKKKSSQILDFCTFHPVEIAHKEADAIAKDYENKIRNFFKVHDGEIPKFDCLLLGMGDDGHTCSLFPGHAALNEKTQLVTGVTNSPKPPPVRVTMTYPLLNAAHNVLFLVRGAGKATTVRTIVKREAGFEKLPAGNVQPAEPVFWLLDNAAASQL